MESKKLILGAESVIEALGYWPSFHDAEVISFSVSRALPEIDQTTVAKLCVCVRQYEEVGAGTADYELVCCKCVLIELVFNDLHHLSLCDFNQQNVIDSIDLTCADSGLVFVEIVSIWGFGGVIRCTSVEVGQITNLI